MTDSALLAAELRVALMRVVRRLRTERAVSELGNSHLTALGLLERCGPMTAGAMATAERVQPPSMTRTIAWLSDAGLVERSSAAHDRRQVLVTLTEAGHAAVADSRAQREAWLARRLELLTPAERETLRAAAALLTRLADQ